MKNQPQSRWFTYVLELIEDDDGFYDNAHGRTTFHPTLDEAKQTIRERLESYDGEHHTQGYIGREEYDERWGTWLEPAGFYDQIVVMIKNDEMIYLNEGRGL